MGLWQHEVQSLKGRGLLIKDGIYPTPSRLKSGREPFSFIFQIRKIYMHYNERMVLNMTFIVLIIAYLMNSKK